MWLDFWCKQVCKSATLKWWSTFLGKCVIHRAILKLLGEKNWIIPPWQTLIPQKTCNFVEIRNLFWTTIFWDAKRIPNIPKSQRCTVELSPNDRSYLWNIDTTSSASNDGRSWRFFFVPKIHQWNSANGTLIVWGGTGGLDSEKNPRKWKGLLW